MKQYAKSLKQGTLDINGIKISCAVLDDDNFTRVISRRSIAMAFGIKGGGAYWKKKKLDGGEQLPEYVSANYLKNFISKELREKLLTNIPYEAVNKVMSEGVEATVLPDICDLWIRAKEAGALSDEQKKIAEKSYILMRGFANIGIVALIDEATGFQDIRPKLQLQRILDKFLKPEFAKWAKRFPDDFYELMYQLRGWEWKGIKVNRPSVVGRYTNDLVYERLAPGILSELKRLNPPNDSGVRKSKHHQWLTDEIGHPALQQHLAILMALMRANPTNWGAFHRSVERALPKLGETIPLALEE